MALTKGDVDEAVLFAKVRVRLKAECFSSVLDFARRPTRSFYSKPFFQFDFENRIHGANFLAYPPVVAGGNRANTLHYINNNQMIKVKERCPILIWFIHRRLN